MASEGKKTFVNETDKNLNIILFVRAGDNPEDEYGTQAVPVGAQKLVDAVYLGEPGSLGQVYLNGLLVEWNEGQNLIGVSQKVVRRSDDWDNTLNENNTVTITQLASGTLSASGSNT